MVPRQLWRLRGPTPATPPAPAPKPLDPAWAWAAYEPDPARPWNLRWAGHLYRRAAFGATWDELQQAVRDGPARTIDRLLRPEGDLPAFNRTCDQYEAEAESAEALRAWWLRRMILTPHPLLEKMTLFWHSHFGISNARVESGPLMREHLRLLRQHALGRFEPLLAAVAQDPATLLGLEAGANRRAQPNEHYARGLMEWFTLGPGRCPEQDLREVARALTGWFVIRNELRYIPREHDPGPQKILGREGSFEVQDVVRIALEQESTPRHLVGKLYRWLVSETEEPAEALVAPLAESFARDYDIGRLVETILRSNLFFSEVAYRRRVKGPVEYALSIVRALEQNVPAPALAEQLAALGQDLLHPPTIRGWPGGPHWITRATLVGRSNLALALVGGGQSIGNGLDPLAVARKHGFPAPLAAARFLVDLFLQGDLPEQAAQTVLAAAAPRAQDDAARALRRAAHTVWTLPEFQLA
ncbi:MAG: DUF1800 domain-containing protein [Thermoguttaceae bacterium]